MKRILSILATSAFLFTAVPAFAGDGISVEDVEDLVGDGLPTKCVKGLQSCGAIDAVKNSRKACKGLRTCKKKCRKDNKGKEKRQCKKACRKNIGKDCKKARKALWKVLMPCAKKTGPACLKEAKSLFGK